MWSFPGTLRLVTSAPRHRFAFAKASAEVTLVGRLKCSEVLPPPIPPSSTFLVFVPLLGYSYSHRPSSHPLSWHLTALLPAVDLRSLYKNPPRLRPSSWPSLMLLWHTLQRPLTRVASIRRSMLLSGTASSPGTAPLCRSILSLPSSG